MSDPTTPAVEPVYGADLAELDNDGLKAQAGIRGVETKGLRSNASLIEAITAHDASQPDSTEAPVSVPEHKGTRYRLASGDGLTNALVVHYQPAGSDADDPWQPFKLTTEWADLPDGLTAAELHDTARSLGFAVENDSEV